ncbi:MAG TPA: tetratricopeptide repeat protein [Nitrospiria bacterium]|nr:tetratricopeptide repeat protein [Nitrospiria bacterium]
MLSFRMMLDTPVWRGVLLSAVLLLTAFTYRGVTANGYVLDDAHLVASNPSIVSFASAGRWFTTPYATSTLREHPGYRPITVASYAIDRALWPNPAVGFHRTNLLIHLIAVVLVALLARLLWADGTAALAVAAVMALHPINAEAVNYLSARSSSLAALFVLTSIWAYDRAMRPSHGRGASAVWFGAALAAGALALGAKEIAVALPVLILIWDRARFGDHTSWRTSATRSLPFWAITAAFLAARSIVMGQAPVPSAGASGQTALFAMKIVLTSFGQWFVPVGLAVDRGWPWTIGAAEAAWLSLGFASVAAVTAWAFRYDRRIGWCLIWSWGALAPLAALPAVSRVTLYQDHRVYLAGIGLAWALGGLIAAATRAWTGRAFRWIAAATAAVLVTAMIRADLARSAVWVDETRLWEDVLSKYPNSVVALNARGLQSLNAGRFDDAERDFQTTLRLVPGSSEAHKNLGLVYAEAGDLDRAVREMNAALALSPGSPGILVELGFVYERAKDWASAKQAYEQVLQSSPSEVLALKGLARAAEREQRFDEAAPRYRAALAVDPRDDHAWLSLGAVLVRLERWSEARDAFTAVLSRHPGNPQARFNLGAALDGLGDAAGATQAYAQAAASLPRDADLAFRIGLMHAGHGRWAEAAAAYEDALRRDPRHAAGHLGLARVAEQLGDPQRALTHYRAALASEPPNASVALREQATAAIKRLEGGKGR